MTTFAQSNPAPLLPPCIADPLRQVAKRRRLINVARGGIQAAALGLASVLAAALLLACVNFPAAPVGVRIAVAAVVWGGVLAAAAWLLRPALARRTLVQTARDVERQIGSDHHERLSCAVSLAADADLRFAGSPELVRHLIGQAEADAAAVDAVKLVPAGGLVRWALLLVPVVAAWVALAMAVPQRVFPPLYQLILPWRVLPAGLAEVAVRPGDVALAVGDTFSVSAHINSRAGGEGKATIRLTDAAGRVTTHAMTPAGPREFRFDRENVAAGFRYAVVAGGAESPTYTATVYPRPAVERIEVRYEYPAYTALPAKTDVDRDGGAIAGPAGTRVTVVVHSPAPLAAESRLVVSTDGETTLPLRPAGEGRYEAQLMLARSGAYRVKLVGTDLVSGAPLTNRDDEPRPVTVRPDEPPAVVILSPAAALTVPPTDVVPVAFRATDDFGVAKVEAVVEVEGAPEQTIPVPPAGADRRAVAGTFRLSVPDVLAAAGKPDAGEITYRLRVADNRAPDAQWAESARQRLTIRRDADTAAAQLDREGMKDLTEAIRQAVRNLDQAKPLAEQAQNIDPARPLSADERRRAERGKAALEAAAGVLAKAADAHADDDLAEAAAKAKDVATGPIADAAEGMGKAILHGDEADGPQRRQDAEAAARQIDRAKRELQDLLKATEELAKNLDASHRLDDLAREQERIADAMDPDSPDDPRKNRDDQQRVAQKTREVIDRTPALRDPKAAEQARELAALSDKVGALRREQAKQDKQLAKQAAADAVKQQATALAERQVKLNGQIDELDKAAKKALDKGGNPVPSKSQREKMVSDLGANRLREAEGSQRRAADALADAARRLDAKADATPPAAAAAATARQLAEAQSALARDTADQARAKGDADRDARPREQAAADQRRLADQTADARRQAQDLNRQAGEQNNPDLAARAEAAERALDAANAAQQESAQAQTTGDADAAAAAQKKAGQSLAKAQNSLRGQPDAAANADPARGAGQNASQRDANPSAGKAPDAAAEKAASQRAAAAAAQEASAAQAQASRGDPAASAQAASALARAARAMAQAARPGRVGGQSQADGREPVTGTGRPAQTPSPAAGQSADPQSGLAANANGGGSGSSPQAVQDLGVSAADWAKLAPLQRQELLDAARQAGPPEYQGMIRNYYTRLARMGAGER